MQGKKFSCTRDNARECEQWADQKRLESNIRKKAEKGIKPTITFKELLEQYFQHTGQYNPSASSRKWMQGQIKAFDERFGCLSGTSIYDINPRQLTNWRNKSLKKLISI